jgi:beta-glucanase (GH16 family)
LPALNWVWGPDMSQAGRRTARTGTVLLALAGIARLGEPARAQAFNPNNPGASGYSLSFTDDFQTVNQAVWELDWWYDTPDACQTAYLPGTAIPSASGLTLHVQSLETIPACVAAGQIYSAAHLDSYGAFSQKFGFYEASIQSSAVGGTLTAFWLLPASGTWPPELDIEEIRGDFPNLAYMTYHYGQRNKQTQYVFTAPSSLGNTFHTYAALLTQSTIVWYIDGVQRGQTTRQKGENAPLFPIFSLYTGTCGDGWAGCPGQTTGWSANAYVAWVKVWQAPKR